MNLGHELSIKRVQVQGPFSIETAYDVCLNGRAIKGARHDSYAEAQQELAAMQRVMGGRHANR